MIDSPFVYAAKDQVDAELDRREPPGGVTAHYNIVLKCLSANHWQVWWDDEMVYEHQGKNAEFCSDAFANGLEQGITGSKAPLYAHSKIEIRGWMDYLDGFDSYEHWRDAG